MNLSSRELEAHELLVEGELQADVEGEAGGGPRQVRRVLGRRRIRPYQRLAGIRRRRHPSAARPFHQFGRRVERRAERRRRLEVARVAVEAPGQGQPRRGPSGPWRLGPRRRRRRGAREQRKTEAAQRRAPLQGPRLGLGRDDRELGAAGLDGRRGFGVHSGLTGGGGSSFDGLFPGASGAAPSPALFRLFPGAAGAPAAGMGRGCALAVEATSGRLPRLPKVTVLSRQRLPPKDDI